MSDFSDVTELPGAPFPEHAFSMLATRYAFARERCRPGGDCLELACGCGAGLGYLARTSGRVCGLDIDDGILAHARRHYAGRDNIEVRQGDASELPYGAGSFDAVLIFEAIYYFPDFEKVLTECARVLKPGGRLLLVTVNREWPGFNPSPHSVRYYSARELSELLTAAGWQPRLFGGFPEVCDTPAKKLKALLKRAAVALRLIPKTMRGKVLLKRLFCGRLRPYPEELQDGMGQIEPLEELSPALPCTRFINLYAVAERGER